MLKPNKKKKNREESSGLEGERGAAPPNLKDLAPPLPSLNHIHSSSEGSLSEYFFLVPDEYEGRVKGSRK